MKRQNRPRPAFYCPQALTVNGCGYAALEGNLSVFRGDFSQGTVRILH